MELSVKKKCNSCGLLKSLDNFSKGKGTFSVRGSCKICEGKKYKKWANSKGKQIVKECNNRYYQRNKFSFDYRALRYKTSAAQRGLEFALSKEECFSLFDDFCFYCGDREERMGIDRIDNTKGYIIDNVVPCCKKCNLMKNVYTAQDFIEHCRKIVENNAIN